MLVTITATRPPGAGWPATDLGYLLAKNPDRMQSFEHAFGRSRVFYPRADDAACTVALLLEIDPIALVKTRNLDSADFALSQYVNDRPYSASSLLAVALGQVFRTAIRGTSKERPLLAATALPLTIQLPAVPASATLIEQLFAPLGWEVAAEPIALDPAFPDWGASRYCDVTLTGVLRLADALSQLYVLLPVLDGAKHYWISAEEVDKLLRAGEAWLPGHPDRELITRRYLGRRPALVRTALGRLAESDEVAESELDNAIAPDEATEAETEPETQSRTAAPGEPESAEQLATAPAQARKLSLTIHRREAVLAALKDVGAKRVLDLGCGGGALLRALMHDRFFTEIIGVDVSARALQYATRSLHLDRQPEMVARRMTLKQGSLTYTDSTLKGYDAAVLMEVIEHVDPPRLGALEHAVFGAARPTAVIVTTPNAEYNVLYETLEAGRMRHRDHRFEWTRAQFTDWAQRVGATHGYTVEYRSVGDVDPVHGASTQMAVFTDAALTGSKEVAA
ncbi:MAG TPA: 3' terminal RNA ribose 2'-O-methyltransferase Hen1 [Actinocrinis sp.]|nr:3' terminal RNA ribose 2'-O-methyltransferase Hen1 [Actinocrinis sp.]